MNHITNPFLNETFGFITAPAAPYLLTAINSVNRLPISLRDLFSRLYGQGHTVDRVAGDLGLDTHRVTAMNRTLLTRIRENAAPMPSQIA